jgi:hypothetical protein
VLSQSQVCVHTPAKQSPERHMPSSLHPAPSSLPLVGRATHAPLWQIRSLGQSESVMHPPVDPPLQLAIPPTTRTHCPPALVAAQRSPPQSASLVQARPQ